MNQADIGKKPPLLWLWIGILACLVLPLQASAAGSAAAPTNIGQITSGFGWRIDPFTGGQRFHGGIDIAAPSGTPVYATQPGLVMFSGSHGGYGNVVVLNHGNSLYTLYGHNSRLLVRPGQPVYRGQVISLVGSTGRSTGPHLHFEVHYNQQYANPMLYLSYVRKGALVAAKASQGAAMDSNEGLNSIQSVKSVEAQKSTQTKQTDKPAVKKTAKKPTGRYRPYNATVQLVNGTKIRTLRF